MVHLLPLGLHVMACNTTAPIKEPNVATKVVDHPPHGGKVRSLLPASSPSAMKSMLQVMFGPIGKHRGPFTRSGARFLEGQRIFSPAAR